MDWMQTERERMQRIFLIVALPTVAGMLVGAGLTVSFFASARVELRTVDSARAIPTLVSDTAQSLALHIPPSPNFPSGFAQSIICYVFSQGTGYGSPIPPLQGGICPPGSVPSQCSDGIDNDSDGLIDLADSGCSNAADNSELNPPLPPAACSD